MATKVWIQQVATSPNQCICPLKWSLHRKYYMKTWYSLFISMAPYYFLVFSILENILKCFMAWRQLNAMLCNGTALCNSRSESWVLLSALAGMVDQVHVWWTSLVWRRFISYSLEYSIQVMKDSILIHFEHITFCKFVFQSHSAGQWISINYY
jgi:hypothetical protein